MKKATNAKVAVYTCGLDITQTETKGTVLLKNADEMLNFTTDEEKHVAKVLTHSLSTPHPALTLHNYRYSKKSPTPASK